MRKILFAAVAALFATAPAVHAQTLVPNGDLETWTGTGTRLHPQGWITTDDLLTAGGFPLPLNNVTRTITAHGGQYAAQLATASLFGQGVPGFLSLGPATNLNINANFPGGIPYTGRPTRMEFYYKLTGPNAVADSATAAVSLTRWVNGAQETVADTMLLFTRAATSFTLVSLPLKYRTTSTPDSLHIFFASGLASSPTVGTTLTIDDVALAGTATATRDARADAALTVYPTRSTDGHFALSAPTQPALLGGTLWVSDATGRPVLTEVPAATGATRTLTLPAGTPPGLYLLRLETPAGPLTRKLVVE